jgi:Tfp pilus assembly protein PilX
VRHSSIKKQQGVVLIWALAILLVLTILGVSSVQKANMGTKIAGNSMASMMVFQGAESALGKISNNNYINEASLLPAGTKYVVPQTALPDEAVSGGNINSAGSVMYMNPGPCPVTSFANSTTSSCLIYQLEVESRLRGTGARTEHVQGVAIIAAPANAHSN